MDLSTNYLGLKLRTPLVPSAGPLCEELDNIKKMEDAGASAVVLHSLFEEQLSLEAYELDRSLTQGTESFAEAQTYFPEMQSFRLGPEDYLEHISKAKESVGIPIIASLNGVSDGGWIDYSKKIQEAGADALELNIYYIPTDMEMTGEQVEDKYISILKAVKEVVNIPVAVKLSPFFSNIANMAGKLDRAGANALVLFNRFYQPEINLEELEVEHNVLLSTPQARRLPMRWIAILYGKVEADLAATSGIHTGKDALKMLMVGSKVTMLCSVLLKQGIDKMKEIETEIVEWLEEHEYESVEQLQGSLSQKKCPEPSAYERAQYMKILKTFHIA
ncbi:MAG: dihydroorotate dehydrogenase-like protein [Verrucomicrobia bacterium]|nr:dihydroorotate dehydrogenase-like protein [Verrucomicrobiota bacterium]